MTPTAAQLTRTTLGYNQTLKWLLTLSESERCKRERRSCLKPFFTADLSSR